VPGHFPAPLRVMVYCLPMHLRFLAGSALAATVVLLSACTNPKPGSLASSPADGDGVALDGGSDEVLAPTDGLAADLLVDSPLAPADGARDGLDGAPDLPPDAPVGQSSDGSNTASSNGAPCNNDGQCVTGYCVDGVCCGTRCAGTCQGCTQTRTGKPDGTCAPVTAGGDPDSECPAQPAAQCGNLGGCDGAGACLQQPATVSCGAAACAGSTFTPERRCDGRGQCAVAQPTSCGLFKCTATGCPTTCYGDGDCATGSPCISGACGGKRSNGVACTRSDECGSGYCVDGVCCGSPCNGLCEACTQARTGQADGTCQAVRNGEDPDGECNEESAATCGKDGFCDGARACRTYGITVTCLAAACSGSSFTPARTCDGRGTCRPASPASCGLARCTATGCITTCSGNQDCVAPAICSNGSCVSSKPQGSACSGNGECSSNYCVDGYCCGGACTGPCQGCSQAKTGMANGVCAGITTGTDPDNDCAMSDPTTCGNDGFCDGAGGCRKHGLSAVCGQPYCSGSTAYLTRGCNGQGACNPQMSQVCPSTTYCQVGGCIPKSPTGSGCASPDQCATGHCVDGYCCENACTAPCRSCTYGMCNQFVDRQREVGTCEGRNWCVAGNCVAALHWQDGGGNFASSITYPFNVKVGQQGGIGSYYVANGNSGIGTATSWIPSLTPSGEGTISMNGCAGQTLSGGQRCAVDVLLSPTSAGMKTFTITASNGLGDTATMTYYYTAVP